MLKNTLDTRALIPPDASKIAGLRNSLLHFQSAGASGDTNQTQTTAREFIQAALDFTEWLARPETRVFPQVLRIDEIKIDKWRRRVIYATNDGGTSERLFTDKPVRPGDLYLMRPLNNPWRVDPILIPFG